MITALRKNWIEVLLICSCAALVSYRAAVYHSAVYLLGYVGFWLLCRFLVGDFASRRMPLDSSIRHMLLVLSPIYAVGMSEFILRSESLITTYMSVSMFAMSRFNLMNGQGSRGTNWPFLIKLISATLIFIVCFFALIFFNSV